MPPTSTQPPASEPPAGRDWPPELLTPALERAVQVARRDAGTRGAPAPPTSLRPVLGFTKRLPSRALRSVQGALDADDGFRRRVAEGADEAELGRAAWLYLTRPDGWQDELAPLVDAVVEEQRDTAALRSELSAQRRVEQLGESLERLRSELAEVRSEQARVESDLARERAARLAADAARDELVERVASLEAERARAVKELKAAEATATARLEDLRAARARLEPLEDQVRALEDQLAAEGDPSPPVDGPTAPSDGVPAASDSSLWADRDPAAVAAAVTRAAHAAAALGEALAAASEALTPTAPDSAPPSNDGVPSADTGPAPVRPRAEARSRPPRRVPVRLRGGVHDGSAEGLQQLLEVAGIVAIVDGYNVSMEGWPSLDQHGQRTSLVSALGGLQARVPAAIHVVFDGDADGRRPTVAAPLPVRVHFSPADTEADDVILSMVAGLPTDAPVLVVSSDRRVAEGARRLGANAVRSSVLLDLLRR